MTWSAHASGYDVFFNRDERLERLPAEPPRQRSRAGREFLAPADGDFGGTWIAVSDRGLCLCLLNGFPAEGGVAERAAGDYETRGVLPLELIDADSAAAVSARLAQRELARFRPFVLVALDAAGGGRLASWSGTALDIAPAPPTSEPLVSSSFCTAEVRRSRVELFRRMQADASADPLALRLAYHRSHAPRRGPLSPCMHRADGSTVSFSHVRVDERRVRFDYVDGAPCLARGPAVSLNVKRCAVGLSKT